MRPGPWSTPLQLVAEAPWRFWNVPSHSGDYCNPRLCHRNPVVQMLESQYDDVDKCTASGAISMSENHRGMLTCTRDE